MDSSPNLPKITWLRHKNGGDFFLENMGMLELVSEIAQANLQSELVAKVLDDSTAT